MFSKWFRSTKRWLAAFRDRWTPADPADAFEAAGKAYRSVRQLKAREREALASAEHEMFKIPVYEDIHGRRVLHFWEKFPGLDSFDSLYEDRYSNWYAIADHQQVTLVYQKDDTPGVQVHENYTAQAETAFEIPWWIDGELIAAGLIEPLKTADDQSGDEMLTESTKEDDSLFVAAGRSYLTVAQLKAKSEGELDGVFYRGYKVPVYRDAFGRRVLYFRERFPCFDSYDRLHENRHYHWYAIENGDKVTLVYTQDEKPGAQVHEDYQPDAKTAFYSPEWIDRELINAGLFGKKEG